MASSSSRIIATGMTKLVKSNETATTLKQQALKIAMNSVGGLRMDQLDGLITVPSLSEGRFMDAHFLATQMKLLPSQSKMGMMAKTIDTGGASPVSALIEADSMIRNHGYSLVAIVAGDAVASMSTEDFLEKANMGCGNPNRETEGAVIPEGYNSVAEWYIKKGAVTRRQLAMVSVLMSRQAVKHPYALTKISHTLDTVMQSAPIASVTTLLECARRADGAAAIIVASPKFIEDNLASHNNIIWSSPKILGGGEASGSLYPPDIITEDMFSCQRATRKAFKASSLSLSDIEYFGIYDCFPICFIKAIEAVGLAAPGCGGQWVEEKYLQSERQGGVLSPQDFPVNTHGGLLSFGAPWETPAMHSIVEAVMHLTDLTETNRESDKARQVPNAKHALVYGNGGIFSASAVAILGRGNDNNNWSRK